MTSKTNRKRIRFSCAANDTAASGSPILLNESICASLYTAQRLGFDAVELHILPGLGNVLPDLIQAKNATGISISALVTGKLYTQCGKCLTSTDPQNRADAIHGMERYIDLAAALQTDLIIGWIRGSRQCDQTMQEYELLLADALDPLSQRAAKCGVRLMIEAINRYEINTMNTAEQILCFLNRTGLQNLYVHLDSFHMNIEESNPVDAILSCDSHLGYYHAADNTRRFPGSGTINISAQMQALHKIAYTGYVSLECLPEPTVEDAAVIGLQTLRTCIACAEKSH